MARPTVLERLERLPRRGLTVLALQGISTLVPGGWTNIRSAEDLIKGTSNNQEFSGSLLT